MIYDIIGSDGVRCRSWEEKEILESEERERNREMEG